MFWHKKIKIARTKGFPNAEFEVSIEGNKYTVGLTEDYYQKLTGGKISPEELIEKSFEFLLEREPKESILKKFNLQDIQKYFPEYETEISQA